MKPRICGSPECDFRNTLRTIRNDCSKHMLKAREEPLNNPHIEQVGCIFQCHNKLLTGVPRPRADIGSRDVAIHRNRSPGNFTGYPLQVIVGLLHGEHGLENRRSTHIPFRVQRFNELFERQIFIFKSRSANVPDRFDKLVYSGVAVEVKSQRQGIGEHSDQTLKLRVIAAMDRRTNDQVGLCRVSRQRYCIDRQQQHIQRATVLSAIFDRRLIGIRPDMAFYQRTAVALCGAGLVTRKIQQRQVSGQVLTPVAKLLFVLR